MTRQGRGRSARSRRPGTSGRPRGGGMASPGAPRCCWGACPPAATAPASHSSHPAAARICSPETRRPRSP
jgi:hypothetical protein